MQDFSQSKEQGIILSYFSAPPGVTMAGTQLSIGENDGETFSNARALTLLGWNSVLVEPSPTAFLKLSQLHRFVGDMAPIQKLSLVHPSGRKQEIVLVNAAITTADGPIDFYDSGTHLKKGDTSLLSTTRPEEMLRWKKSGEQFTKTTVRGITFETLMRETGVRHYDMISIDCEGADYDVLKQIDLREVGCKMLCVEFNQMDERKFVDYVQQFGLKLHHKTYENLIFAL